LVNQEEVWRLQRVNLLSAMALYLGYTAIRQTDMIRDYYPEGHDNLMKNSLEFQAAQLSYLKTGAELYQIAIDNAKKQTPGTDQQQPQ
jgi:hypothetical protein